MTRLIDDVKLDFSDVLLMPKRSELDSRSKVNLVRKFKFKHSSVQYEGVSIIVSNMDHTGTFAMADAVTPFHMSVALHKFYTAKALIEYFGRTARNPHVFYSMGITDSDFEKFESMMTNPALAESEYVVAQAGVPSSHAYRPTYVCIDVANGYSRKFVAYVEKIRAKYPNIVIMAGNVVTPDMTYDLLERGADIVKIGIGPGSVCTTRRITGVGYPQLSAIMECADAAHGANGLICGDGGVTCPGDIAKAFAAGADFVMCGGLFAGHQECEGEMVGKIELRKEVEQRHESARDPHTFEEVVHQVSINKKTGEQWHETYNALTQLRIKGSDLPLSWYDPETIKNAKMRFYGMSSAEAMDKHYGGKADYRASEGKAVEVPYKGSIVNTVEEILGGLRSACTYLGSRTLKDISKCATLVKVNHQLNDVFGE